MATLLSTRAPQTVEEQAATSQPYTVVVKKATIRKYYQPNAVYDITKQIVMVDIFETIYGSTVFCKIGVDDGIGLNQNAAGIKFGDIIGEEIIQLSFITPGSDTQIDYEFIVNACTQVAPTTQGNSTVFYMHCVPKEYITNFTSFVRKSYNDTYSGMVSDIVKSYLKTNQQVNIYKSKGVQQIVVPRLTPLAAIDFMRARSVAQNYEHSPFLFFQNRRGFNFIPLAALVDKPQNDYPIPEYFYADISEMEENVSAKVYYSILNITQDQRFETVNKVKDGIFGSNVNQFDIVTKQYTTTDFKLREQIGKFDLALEQNKGNFNTAAFIDEYGAPDGTTMFFVVDGNRPETFFVDTAGMKNAYAYLMQQNTVTVELYGNTRLTAGDVLDINMFAPRGTNQGGDDRIKDKFFSGRYIISNLRHMLVAENNGFSHKTFCTLIKGTNAGEVA